MTLKKQKRKKKDWTEPYYLYKQDHRDLKEVRRLYRAGKLKEAMEYASKLDTVVRDQIPADIWRKMGGW